MALLSITFTSLTMFVTVAATVAAAAVAAAANSLALTLANGGRPLLEFPTPTPPPPPSPTALSMQFLSNLTLSFPFLISLSTLSATLPTGRPLFRGPFNGPGVPLSPLFSIFASPPFVPHEALL